MPNLYLRCFLQVSTKQSLEAALGYPAIPCKRFVYLTLKDPFLKPNESVGITYGFIGPSEKNVTLITLKPLLSLSSAPSNDICTSACPTMFFLT